MDIFLNKYLLISIYFIFSLLLIFKLKFKSYSFLTLFIIYTFFTYFLGYIVFEYFPEYSTLIPLPQKRSNSFFHENYYNYSFFIFLVGYFFFSLPFLLFNKFNLEIINNSIQEHQINKIIEKYFLIIFSSFLLLNYISYKIRNDYIVGVPYGTPKNKIAEYSWYTFDYLTIIILIYIIFFGLKSNKHFYRFISAISVIIYGFTTAILGWKSGSIWALIIVIHLVFIIHYFYKKQKKIKILFLIFIILTLVPAVFILSNNLRHDRSFVENITYDKIKSKIELLISSSFTMNNFLYVYNRATGISPLFVTVAYEDPNKENNIYFYDNLFKRGTYQPETYFSCNVLKYVCPPNFGSYAPTGWSTFYIYNRVYGVIIGFFVLGLISVFIENVFINLKNKILFLPLFTSTYAMSFPAMIFEGTITFYFKRHVLSLFLAFTVFLLFIFFIKRLIHRLEIKI